MSRFDADGAAEDPGHTVLHFDSKVHASHQVYGRLLKKESTRLNEENRLAREAAVHSHKCISPSRHVHECAKGQKAESDQMELADCDMDEGLTLMDVDKKRNLKRKMTVSNMSTPQEELDANANLTEREKEARNLYNFKKRLAKVPSTLGRFNENFTFEQVNFGGAKPSVKKKLVVKKKVEKVEPELHIFAQEVIRQRKEEQTFEEKFKAKVSSLIRKKDDEDPDLKNLREQHAKKLEQAARKKVQQPSNRHLTPLVEQRALTSFIENMRLQDNGDNDQNIFARVPLNDRLMFLHILNKSLLVARLSHSLQDILEVDLEEGILSLKVNEFPKYVKQLINFDDKTEAARCRQLIIDQLKDKIGIRSDKRTDPMASTVGLMSHMRAQQEAVEIAQEDRFSL